MTPDGRIDLDGLGAVGHRVVHGGDRLTAPTLVDAATIRVMRSDDPRFTASVVEALGLMRFRPARRGGRTVRQLVQQKFRFKIMPAADLAKQFS